MNITADKSPQHFLHEITSREVVPGRIVTWWLGGSGFVFKTPRATQIWIDPYLSDMVHSAFGLARAFPSPLVPEKCQPDVIIATHWHEDHLDPITIPIIARHSSDTRFVMPPSAMARAIGWGIPRQRIVPLSWGETIEAIDVKIVAVPARHEAGIAGWEVPDAMGVILEAEGIKIYNTGDTEYDLRLRALKAMDIDVFQGCINGVGGNMNAHEAALLAWHLQVETAIPMHHVLWATNPGGDAATLDPRLFADTYARLGGKGKVIVPNVADPIELCSRQDSDN